MRIIDLILNLDIEEEMTYSIDDIGYSKHISVKGDIIRTTITDKKYKRDNIKKAFSEYGIDYTFEISTYMDGYTFIIFLSTNYKYLIVLDFSNNKDDVIVLDIQEVRSQDISYSTILYGKILQYEMGY